MNRRELLHVLGACACLPALPGRSVEGLGIAGRRVHAAARGRALQVLDPHQSETVATIAELIIPATDTPGARAAQVHRFIDLLLAEWASDDERAQFLKGLADVDARARTAFGGDFLSATDAQRGTILTQLDAEAQPGGERDQFIQRHCYACNEYSGKFFVNDRENPYSFDPDKPFHWIRGRQVGGRSIMWGRQVYRWSDLDFGANARDGFGVDWPIRYADI